MWRRIALVAAVVFLVFTLSTCSLLGRLRDFVEANLENVKIKVVDMADGLSLNRFRDVADAAAVVVRPIQKVAGQFFMLLRGLDLFEILGAARDYAIVLWEDIDGDGEIDEGEPFVADDNEGAGFPLDMATSLIGPVRLGAEGLEYTAYTLDVDWDVVDVDANGFDVTFTAVVPGAETVVIHYNQSGWYPAGDLMTRDGDVFTVTLANLDAGPFAYKFEIDGEQTWFADPNEPGYFPNYWTFWEDKQIDWNSAILLADDLVYGAQVVTQTVNLQLAELDRDGLSDTTPGNYTVQYKRVEPFWQFGAFLENPSADIHTALSTGMTTAATPGDVADGWDLVVERGGYYLAVITGPYLEHRVYFYAVPELDDGTVIAHLSQPADITAIYAARGITEPSYDDNDVYRGFVLVNYTAELSGGGQVRGEFPWEGTLDFGYSGLEIARLPYTGGDGDPFVYQILMLDEDVAGAGEPGIMSDIYNLDFTDPPYTNADFPAQAQYFGYTSWDGRTSADALFSGAADQPELAVILGPVGGMFFLEYAGVGHLIRVPGFKSDTDDQYGAPHNVEATVEVVLP